MLNRRTSLIGLALGAAVAGCRDTAAPDKNFALTLTVNSQPAPVLSDTPNGPRITCNLGLTATATGSGSAEWEDVRTFFYFGTDRTVAADTTANTASEAQSAFGSATIVGGETRHASWYLYAGAPFEATIGFAYKLPDGTTSTASTHVTCGPTPQGEVVPTITQLSVPSTTGELKVGDVITVTYLASSPSGLWESVVTVAGGFQGSRVIAEELATTANHSVQFVVPNDVKPGVPITISAIAWNAALVRSSKVLNTQLQFIDRTPPTITSARTTGGTLTGQYAPGDTLTLTVDASDNAQLGWLVYQLGSPANYKDSVAATAGAASQEFVVNLPIRPEWVGSPVLSVTVRDASGLTSQTVSSASDSIRVYPIVNRPATTALSLSSNATNDMVYDAKRDLMYIGIQSSNQVLVLSPSTMTLKPSIQLPQAPAGMDLSLSGDSLLVAMPLDGTIAVVNLNDLSAQPSKLRLSVLDTVAITPGVGVAPSGLRVAANGKMFVMLTDATANGGQTVEVDLSTGAQRIRADGRALSVSYTDWPQFMGRASDRSRIYVLGNECKAWYTTSTDAFTPCGVGMSAQELWPTFDAAGKFLTRGGFVYDADVNLVWDVGPIAHVAQHAALSPDGATVYLGGGQNLTTARLADRTMLSRSSIPVSADRLLVSPNGTWLLAFQDSNGAKVTRVDLQ